MKIRNTTILILLFTSVLFGQVPKTAVSIEDSSFNEYFFNKKNLPVIKGKIINITEKEIDETKINYTLVTPFKNFQIKKNTLLKKDGTFELELNYAFPYQQIWLSIGDLYYAGIYANSNLLIELDFNILKSSKTTYFNRELNGVYFNGSGIKYLGNDSELNNFMNNHILFNQKQKFELMMGLEKLKNDKKYTSQNFLIKYDSIYNKIEIQDNEYIGLNPSKYSWLIENERLSDYYGYLLVNGRRGKEVSENLYLAARNLHKIEVVDAQAVDPVSLIRADKVVVTVAALKQLEEALV